MEEKDFLSFLVDETFKLQSSNEAELSSLEIKLQDYHLSFLKGEFLPQLQVLRFQTQFGLLDIPVNWSIFNLENTETDFHLLDQNNDHDHLLTVLKSAWNISLERLLVTHADGFCYIVGLKKGEETYLHDLLNPQEWFKEAA
jgi:hypothetical protein